MVLLMRKKPIANYLIYHDNGLKVVKVDNKGRSSSSWIDLLIGEERASGREEGPCFRGKL